MPELSRFFGITIYMYFRDHPPAHFHAEYGDYEITIEIESGLVSGKFPQRALRLVLEWYSEHKSELKENWKLARNRETLKNILPLE